MSNRKNVPTLLQSLETAKRNFLARGKEVIASYRSNIKKIEQFYCFLQEALSYGYVPDYSEYELECFYFTFLTLRVNNLREFSVIHKIVGNLEHMGMKPKSDDGRCREVIVTLKPKNEAYGFMRFEFSKKLPKGSKCKIVKTVRTSHVVQCNV